MRYERISSFLRTLGARLRHTLSLIDYAQSGVELHFAADFSELFAYLHPASSQHRSSAVFDHLQRESPFSSRHRLARAFLVNNPHRPALLLYPHVLELDSYLRSLATRTLGLTALAEHAWVNLSEHHRTLLRRLQGGDELSQPDILELVALLKGDFEAICADAADYVHRSRFRTAHAKLEQLLSERRILFCGTGGMADPFADIEVSSQDDLEHRLFESFCERWGYRLSCLLDAKAVVFAKGLNDRLPRERVLLVSVSRKIENVLSQDFPHLLSNFCSLESFFLLMLWDGRDSGSWYRKLDGEITTAISAIEEIGARATAGLSVTGGESLTAERFLEALWDSLEGLVNQRLSDATKGREWLFREMRDTPAFADLKPRVAVTDRKLELLLGFVKFVSQDEDFRQQVREESLRTWHQVASAVDGLRQLGRYQVQYSCFISYGTKDLTCAQKIAKDLRAAGARCWYAPDSLKVGADFSQEIEDAIRMHDRLIVIVSENSVRTDWVRREVEAGLEMERLQDRRVVIPLILDSELERSQVSWVAFLRRTRQAADFRGWEEAAAYGDALKRLLRGLGGDEAQAPT